jgi:hypothetical protein
MIMTDAEFERRMDNRQWLTDDDVVDKRTEKLFWISWNQWAWNRLTPEQKTMTMANHLDTQNYLYKKLREWDKKQK